MQLANQNLLYHIANVNYRFQKLYITLIHFLEKKVQKKTFFSKQEIRIILTYFYNRNFHEKARRNKEDQGIYLEIRNFAVFLHFKKSFRWIDFVGNFSVLYGNKQTNKQKQCSIEIVVF